MIRDHIAADLGTAFRMTHLHINYMKYFRAFISLPIYSVADTPAMPLPIGHAHFGGFFYAW